MLVSFRQTAFLEVPKTQEIAIGEDLATDEYVEAEADEDVLQLPKSSQANSPHQRTNVEPMPETIAAETPTPKKDFVYKREAGPGNRCSSGDCPKCAAEEDAYEELQYVKT